MFSPSAAISTNSSARGESAQEKVRNTRRKIEFALFNASATKTIIGAILSIMIGIIAIVQHSNLLAWVGICGVYAFIASIVLRMTNDWVAIASTVTCIGCVTIFTGMQLQDMMQSARMTFPYAMQLFGYSNGNNIPWECHLISQALENIRDILYSFVVDAK
jgi:hypothetical protein